MYLKYLYVICNLYLIYIYIYCRSCNDRWNWKMEDR